MLAELADFILDTTSFTFEPGASLRISFVVELLDDTVFEGREDFTLQLESDQSRVMLSPITTVVSIVDNEGKKKDNYFYRCNCVIL